MLYGDYEHMVHSFLYHCEIFKLVDNLSLNYSISCNFLSQKWLDFQMHAK